MIDINFSQNITPTEEIVGIFSNVADLEKAVDELYNIGIDYSELSMLADKDKLKKYMGGRTMNTEELAHNSNTPKEPYIANENIGVAQGGLIGGLMYVGTLTAASLIIAAGGGIATALTTAAIAGGASTYLGVTLSKMVGEHHAKNIEEQINNGGLILWINLKNPEAEQDIKDVLTKNFAHHIEKHTINSIVHEEA